MARTKITRTLMGDDNIDHVQIVDHGVYRDDLNITTSGEAVITKVIAGTNITLSSTGVDTGTGDVTINVAAIPAAIDFQLEGVLTSQRSKLNVTDSSEINFTLTDDSANTRTVLTASLINSGVTANTYTKVQVNSKGIITSGTILISSDIPVLDWSKITSGTPTTLAGYGITDAAGSVATTTSLNLKAPIASPTFTGTVSGITATMVGLGNVDNTADTAKPVSTAQQTALNLKADLAGSSTQDFNAKVINTSGSILPTTTQLYDLGSPTQRFKALYVDEAHLAVATLYLGDTAILGTTSQTINIHADVNQSLDIRTSGTGATTLVSATGVTVSTTGLNADVYMNAAGVGANVRIGATNELQVSAAGAAFTCPVTLQSATITNNLTVSGNLIVNGTKSTINSTVVTINDNIVVYNAGEVGSGVTAGSAGIRIDRGDLVDFELIFDESVDMFKMGAIGSLETVASQPWVNSNYSLSLHNHSIDGLNNVTIASKATNDLLKWNGTAWVNFGITPTFIGLSNVDNTTDTAKPVSTAQQTALNLKADLASPTFTGTLTVPTGAISTGTLTTSTTAANQVVMNLSATVYRSVSYQIQVTSGTSYHITTVIVIHDGTTSSITEVTTIYTGISLATFDSIIAGGNIQLVVTPTNAITTIKVIAQAIII